ncbi:hypothetical protein N7509_007711 [Penicillium cosmopolitanum]|uniref:Uncharacterized protein n=1 Tax=Penicillium cosmopolitanum TaxID=1131564 RepID=A0A9W9VZK1_9EURO|nr:uncharacterized protein N7509_007711 [Penicillium cosmopolitanum]KAJ5392221.1 hypothetical protein N7509_007711 [Penicillium cosmopolitanum]
MEPDSKEPPEGKTSTKPKSDTANPRQSSHILHSSAPATQSIVPVMRFQNLVLAFGVLVHTQPTPPEQCATGVHAILIRGQGPGDHLNVMVTIQNLVLQLIPGSTSIALPYKHGADDHRVAAGNGAYLMQEYIREYIADCPNSKIFLHGYSLGGIVLMDGLCGTSSSWLFPVPALEPKYNKSGKLRRIKPDLAKFCPVWRENPKSAWNTSNCRCLLRRGDISSATALEHRDLHQWDGLYPRIHPEWCDPYKDSLRSYCDVGDVECCLSNPPGDNLAHFLYIVKYNMDVIHFIQRRLNETCSQ